MSSRHSDGAEQDKPSNSSSRASDTTRTRLTTIPLSLLDTPSVANRQTVGAGDILSALQDRNEVIGTGMVMDLPSLPCTPGTTLDQQQRGSPSQHQRLYNAHYHQLLPSSLLSSHLTPLIGHGIASDYRLLLEERARTIALLTADPRGINAHRSMQPVTVQRNLGAPPGTISLVEALRGHAGIASHPEEDIPQFQGAEVTSFNSLHQHYGLEEALLSSQSGDTSLAQYYNQGGDFAGVAARGLPTAVHAHLLHPEHQRLPIDAISPAQNPTPGSIVGTDGPPLKQQEPPASTPGHFLGEGSRSAATTSTRTSNTKNAASQKRTKPTRVDASVIREEKMKKRKTKDKTPLKQPTRPIELTHRPPIDLAIASDEFTLSPYQSFLRKQIQLFETTQEGVDAKAQGRNVPIVAGQIGIQCKHCANLPPSKRFSGSVFYSQTLAGLYQIAQNMCKAHLLTRCPNVPEETRERLARLQTNLNRGSGGKEYWHRAATKLGVYEDDNVLKFTKEVPCEQRKENSSKDGTRIGW